MAGLDLNRSQSFVVHYNNCDKEMLQSYGVRATQALVNKVSIMLSNYSVHCIRFFI